MEKPTPDENEKYLLIKVGEERLVAERRNTTLVMYLGALSCYDHIFIAKEDNTLYYIWNGSKTYDNLATWLLENNYPVFLNMLEVSDYDVEAFEEEFFGDIRAQDTLPAEWEEEN